MKAVIIHEDLEYVKKLKNTIEKSFDIAVERLFKNTCDALRFLINEDVDFVFIDEVLDEFEGVCFSEILKRFKYSPAVAFIKNQDSIDNILKKLEIDFKKNNLNKLSEQINILNENKISVVRLDNILFCEAKERYTYIYTNSNEYRLRSSISDVEKMLSSKYFFKCHRSYLVNLLKIEEITPWFNNTYILKLNNGRYSVPVSRSNVKNFRYFMNL